MRDEKIIGGLKYRMEPLGGATGQLVLLRLARPWSLLMETAAAKGTVPQNVLELAATGALSKCLSAIAPEDLEFVTQKFAEKTTVLVPDGPQLREHSLAQIYDSHFSGRYPDMLEWLIWGVKMNRFFGPAPGASSGATAGASSSSSPPASTGGPGVSSHPTA